MASLLYLILLAMLVALRSISGLGVGRVFSARVVIPQTALGYVRSSRPLSCAAAPGAPAAAVAAGEVSELSRLEIRVGKIVEVSKHPEADSLYVEKVDVGEAEGPRTIVSGLVAYCTSEQLLNRNVVVLCNLKPRPLKGITSFGMLLCASTKSGEDKSAVEPLLVPAGAKVGELITFAGHKPEPEPAGNRASKAFTKVADDLVTDDNGLATFKGTTPFMTGAGPITSSMKKASIS